MNGMAYGPILLIVPIMRSVAPFPIILRWYFVEYQHDCVDGHRFSVDRRQSSHFWNLFDIELIIILCKGLQGRKFKAITIQKERTTVYCKYVANFLMYPSRAPTGILEVNLTLIFLKVATSAIQPATLRKLMQAETRTPSFL